MSGREQTLATSARVAKFRAVVVLATQLGITNFLTTETSIIQIINRTSYQPFLFPTVTFVLQSFLTLVASSVVALLLTTVNAAIQSSFASGIAKDLIFLTALHRLGGAAASTASLNYRLTRRTRSRVAELSARMFTNLFAAT